MRFTGIFLSLAVAAAGAQTPQYCNINATAGCTYEGPQTAPGYCIGSSCISSWGGAAVSAGGANGEVQINSGGGLGSIPGFTYNAGANFLDGRTAGSGGLTIAVGYVGAMNIGTGFNGSYLESLPYNLTTGGISGHVMACITIDGTAHACPTSATYWNGLTWSTGTDPTNGPVASVAIAGSSKCLFDNTPTLGDFVVLSTTTAGRCHDAGAAMPSAGTLVGQVTGAAAAGEAPVYLMHSSGSGGGGGSSALSIGYAVTAAGIGLSNLDDADIGAKMNTILSLAPVCKGATVYNPAAPNCVPMKITFDPGRYLITTPIHPTGISWADVIIDCGGASSNYDGGHVIFDVQTPAGTDGWWFDTDPATGTNGVNHGPQFLGCVFEDGTVHTGTGAFNNNPSNVRSGLHFSNVNNIKGDYNTFQYFVGNVFNPNNVSQGTAAPTSGSACAVTNDNYVVTCTVPGTLTAGTVAQFGEGSFNALDTVLGRPFQQEIYSATLAGSTLTINLSTPYQHSTDPALYDWVVQYNGHGFLADGFGALRTANGNTGTTFGFTQYGNYENTHFYCTQFPIWLGGGGVQSYLTGGAIDGSTQGTQHQSLYGTSRIRFYGGWAMNACPGTNNVMAPNNRVSDAIFFFAGGYSDTMQLDMDANAFPFSIVLENGHQHWIRGNYENSGTQPTIRTCPTPLPTSAPFDNPCSRGVHIEGDYIAGSHGQGVRVGSYINTMGIGIELAGTARQIHLDPSILGPGIANLQDIVLPSVGDPNCPSATNCPALQTSRIDGTVGTYKAWVVTAPAPGSACTNPYQIQYGTDGSINICSSALQWTTSGATTMPVDRLVSPSAPSVIDYQAFTQVWRAGQTSSTVSTPTGGNNMFTFRDVATNTGTGTLFTIQTYSGIAGMQPINIQSAVSQWAMYKSGNVALSATALAQDIPTGGNVPSPTSVLCGNYYTGTASASDCYSWLVSLGNGNTGTASSQLFLNHAGTAGLTTLNLTNMKMVLFPNEGRATLASGTVTVADTFVSVANNIQLTNCGVSGAQGMLAVGVIVTNTSFVINSSNAGDNSTVCWFVH